MPHKKYLHYMVIAVTVLMSVTGFAAPPDAGQLLNQQQQIKNPRPDRLPQPEQRKGERSVPQEAAGIKVKLTAIRFSGDVSIVGEQRLQALVGDAVGKELDFNGLQALADRVSAYLRGRGYFLAHAYLPKQYLAGGVVEIIILAGRLQNVDDAIVIQGHTRIAPERLMWIARDAALPGEVVTQRDLERGVLLINDLPGISAASNVERGTEAGTVRLVVNADEGPLLGGEVSLDNFGNRYTGEWRANGRLDVNDPLRIGDRLSVSMTRAADMQAEQVNYGWPIANNGLRGVLSYGVMTYTIGEELADLEATGRSGQIGAGVSYPVIRSRFLNVWAGVNYQNKKFKDDVYNETMRDRVIDAWSASLSGDSYDRLGGGGLNNFSVTISGGDLDLSKSAIDLSIDKLTGANTQGSYAKLNYAYARLQAISADTSFFAAFSGQLASRNLDSSEKFILGGPLGVRAYPTGEATGDEGMLLNLEMRYDLPGKTTLGDLQAIAFVDAGRITLHHTPWPDSVSTSSGSNTYLLSGAGVGINLTRGDTYALRAAWAIQLGSNPGRSPDGLNSDGLTDRSRFWLYGTVRI